eukprot:1432443-Rhodomonas_salina.1
MQVNGQEVPARPVSTYACPTRCLTLTDTATAHIGVSCGAVGIGGCVGAVQLPQAHSYTHMHTHTSTDKLNIVLRARYAMSGTDVGNAAGRSEQRGGASESLSESPPLAEFQRIPTNSNGDFHRNFQRA